MNISDDFIVSQWESTRSRLQYFCARTCPQDHSMDEQANIVAKSLCMFITLPLGPKHCYKISKVFHPVQRLALDLLSLITHLLPCLLDLGPTNFGILPVDLRSFQPLIIEY
jgi:hypothetical protein